MPAFSQIARKSRAVAHPKRKLLAVAAAFVFAGCQGGGGAAGAGSASLVQLGEQTVTLSDAGSPEGQAAFFRDLEAALRDPESPLKVSGVTRGDGWLEARTDFRSVLNEMRAENGLDPIRFAVPVTIRYEAKPAPGGGLFVTGRSFRSANQDWSEIPEAGMIASTVPLMLLWQLAESR